MSKTERWLLLMVARFVYDHIQRKQFTLGELARLRDAMTEVERGRS